ncbi:MAG: DUF433 domain-containing protein, partial [Hyphomicrobiales bacterium]
QLAYWERTGFFRPAHTRDSSRFRAMYSFKDVVALRTLAGLRERLPLQELRKVGAWLRERYDEPWSSLRFFVIGRSVVFEDPQGNRVLAGTDQRVLPIDLGEIERETERLTDGLIARGPEQIGHIVRNRYVQHNAWLLDGTRIPTSAVWNFHEAGYANDEIQREYPRLTLADIEAAIAFEAEKRRRTA